MNFYPHHIGDYLTATAHLSWVEDCAYRRLLDLYYSREQAIPADLAQAARLCRATTKDERKAVESVLAEFFTLTDKGWAHTRCEEEIAKAKGIADRARENGKLGGNPYKKQQYNEPGFLYALDIGDATKVGITKNPQQRLYEHRRKFKGCNYILVVSVRDMGKCEDDLLKTFSQYAVGEKLNLPPEKLHDLAAHMESLGTPVGSPNKGGGLPPNPNPITNTSEANASGADAPPKSPADMTKDELWSAGKSLLEQAGVPRAQCGSLVGKLVKDYGDAVVVEAVRAAVVARPPDPIAYLKAACMHSAGQRSSASAKSFAQQDREEGMRRWEQMTGQVHPDRNPKPDNVIDLESVAIGVSR